MHVYFKKEIPSPPYIATHNIGKKRKPSTFVQYIELHLDVYTSVNTIKMTKSLARFGFSNQIKILHTRLGIFN